MKFHKLGTKHLSYIKRFEKLYAKSTEISFQVIDKNDIRIFDGDKKIDEFSSKTTFQQFFLVMVSLGLMEPSKSGYKILEVRYSFDNAKRAIFKRDEDARVNRYRFSRIICFLYKLNLLDEERIEKINLEQYKKGFDPTSETSQWEEDATKNIDNVLDILERIKNEYKI